ncbi:hypothetical protein U1Q18_000485 [Sarracenia purpurea var. burkii]
MGLLIYCSAWVLKERHGSLTMVLGNLTSELGRIWSVSTVGFLSLQFGTGPSMLGDDQVRLSSVCSKQQDPDLVALKLLKLGDSPTRCSTIPRQSLLLNNIFLVLSHFKFCCSASQPTLTLSTDNVTVKLGVLDLHDRHFRFSSARTPIKFSLVEGIP